MTSQQYQALSLRAKAQAYQTTQPIAQKNWLNTYKSLALQAILQIEQETKQDVTLLAQEVYGKFAVAMRELNLF